MASSSRFRDTEIRAPRGPRLNAKSWLTEAPLRMLMNNLDPDVAENPNELVVYGRSSCTPSSCRRCMAWRWRRGIARCRRIISST